MTRRMGITDKLSEDLDAFGVKVREFHRQLVELRLHFEDDLKKMAADKTVPKYLRNTFVGVLNGKLNPSVLEDLVKRTAARVNELESEIARDHVQVATRGARPRTRRAEGRRPENVPGRTHAGAARATQRGR
jgi:hypothetical protein